MDRGGLRPGAGRPRGAPTRKTLEVVDRVPNGGSPLERLLKYADFLDAVVEMISPLPNGRSGEVLGKRP